MLRFTLFMLVISYSLFSFSADKVLIVLSGASELELQDGKSYKTGFYLNELVLPAMALEKAGYVLEFATPGGVAPTQDMNSEKVDYFKDDKEFSQVKKYIYESKLTHKSKSPVISLKEAIKRIRKYSGVFIPGGHAPMNDLAFSKDLGVILKTFHRFKRPIAMLCHGPVALFSTLDNPRGVIYKKHPVESDWLYKGYAFTVFSTAEEKVAESGSLKGEVTYYPEDVARQVGLDLKIASKWKSRVVVDRGLITGQNPASTMAVATKFLKALRAKK